MYPIVRYFLFVSFFFVYGISVVVGQDNPDSSIVTISNDGVKIQDVIISQRDTVYRIYDTVVTIKNLLIRQKDTLLPKNGRFFNGIDTIYSVKRDTIISFRDTIVTSIDTVFTLNEIVLKKLQNFSKKDNLFSKLFKNVFVYEEKKPPPDTSKSAQKQQQSGQDRYSDYNNKIIGSITIRVLDVFGASMNHPDRKPVSLLEKGGNAIHKTTYKNIIRNKLLFDRGEKVNSIKISESERLLRQTNYLYDARINVLPGKGEDTVDIDILVQDVWSITPDGGFIPGPRATNLSLRDVNFLGLGQEFYNTVRLQKSLPSSFNFISAYNINNLYRTQSLAQIYFRYENGERRYGAGINREYISNAIRFAGGVNFNVYQIFTTDLDTIRRPLAYNYQDVWIGYADKLNKKNEFATDRLVAGARVQRTEYVARPDRRLPSQFNSNMFYLMNLGYVDRTFFKDKYIFRLGRTEDIPEGKLVVLTAGYQKGEKTARPYMGILSTWSKYKSHIGYMYASLGIGAFKTGNSWQEGSYYTKLLYYTPLMKVGGWRLRSFISMRTAHLIKPQPGVFTNVIEDNGLRALNSILLTGTDKLTMNFEHDFFPNFNFIGFRMGFMIFADFAWIGNHEKLFDKDNFYQGFGLGLRIRNENLIFSMMQFIIGIYPGADRINKNNFQFFDRAKYFYNYDDLGISRPSTIPLN